MIVEPKHAIVTRDGYEVPLIGIPPSAVADDCDCCGNPVGLSEAVFTGEQILCPNCAKNST